MSMNSTYAFPNKTTIWFTYQSQSTKFDKWIELFTLCLAPLITHIAFGFADPVILSASRPHWSDRLTQFNPLTIAWRYYAISYRRVRATTWDRADMAAANAVFWDGKRWDGSEETMVRSRDWLTKLPESSHVAFLSGSTLGSIAVTIQAMQEVYYIVGTWEKSATAYSITLTDTFFPLALVSLCRLHAAPWLSNEYGYEKYADTSGLAEAWATPQPTFQNSVDQASPCVQGIKLRSDAFFSTLSQISSRYVAYEAIKRIPETHFLIQAVPVATTMQQKINTRLVSASSRRATLFRLWWLTSVAILCGGGIFTEAISFGPKPGMVIATTTGLLFRLLYVFLGTGGIFIHWMYLLKGFGGSTVIPCIHAWWYKRYTELLGLLALATVVAGCLETRVMPDGSLTTFPPQYSYASPNT